MAEHHLNASQIGARFQEVCCEALAQSVRSDVLGNAGSDARLMHSLPCHLLRNRLLCPPAIDSTGEQVGCRSPKLNPLIHAQVPVRSERFVTFCLACANGSLKTQTTARRLPLQFAMDRFSLEANGSRTLLE